MNGVSRELIQPWRLACTAALVALVAILLPTSAAGAPIAVEPPAVKGVPGLPGKLTNPGKAAATQGLLKTDPESGPVGTPFTLTGENLPPNTTVKIVWTTAKGRYVLNPLLDNVKVIGRQYDEISVVLTSAKTDADGSLEVNLRAPEDYGETHSIFAVAGGRQLARGAFRISRSVTMTPTSGPVGTPITIKVQGLGSRAFESTASILYDNKYAGYVAATTTRGTAVVQIRAAGPVGRHVVEFGPASAAVNYLNIEQAPVWYVGKTRFTFNVTSDAGAPPAELDWPAKVEPTLKKYPTLTGGAAKGTSAKLSSTAGPILSKVDLNASGLSNDEPVEVEWVSAVGARASPSGWELVTRPLGTVDPSARGRAKVAFEVPDDLGGWHAVRLTQGGKLKAEVPYYVERSLVAVTPTKVKAGETFQIQIKGVGWTELDNGFAVTYDNGYIGYACGFNSQGDVTMDLVAAGGPGTHLIDLYPYIYLGDENTDRWLTQVPMLAFKQDAPGLALGYRLPAIRLAIEVVG